jgi:hypothetical protein
LCIVRVSPAVQRPETQAAEAVVSFSGSCLKTACSNHTTHPTQPTTTYQPPPPPGERASERASNRATPIPHPSHPIHLHHHSSSHPRSFPFWSGEDACTDLRHPLEQPTPRQLLVVHYRTVNPVSSRDARKQLGGLKIPVLRDSLASFLCVHRAGLAQQHRPAASDHTHTSIVHPSSRLSFAPLNIVGTTTIINTPVTDSLLSR